MTKGVEIHKINVQDTEPGHTTLEVTMTIAGDDEFDAIGWVVGILGEKV